MRQRPQVRVRSNEGPPIDQCRRGATCTAQNQAGRQQLDAPLARSYAAFNVLDSGRPVYRYDAAMHWIDGHLDLAYISQCGCDLTRDEIDPDKCCVSLPTLRQAGVTLAFATIFTEPGVDQPYGYPP